MLCLYYNLLVDFPFSTVNDLDLRSKIPPVEITFKFRKEDT